MQERDVQIALENYHYYVKSLREAQEKLDEFLAKKEKVGGSIARRPENPMDDGKRKIINMDREDALTAERDQYQHNVKIVDSFMEKLKDFGLSNDKSMMVDWYIRKRSIEWLTEHYFVGKMQIYRRRDYLIGKFIIDLEKDGTSNTCQGDIMRL